MNLKLFKLAKMILNFSKTETDKGILIADTQLAEGVEVYIEVDGELTVAPDGEYETETQVITVTEGKVTAIKEKEVKEETTETEELEVEPVVEPVDETAELEARIAELEAVIAEKDENIAQLEELLREKELEEKAREEFEEQTPAFKETEETKTVMSLAEAAKSVYNK